jgi:hypothetical protein
LGSAERNGKNEGKKKKKQRFTHKFSRTARQFSTTARRKSVHRAPLVCCLRRTQGRSSGRLFSWLHSGAASRNLAIYCRFRPTYRCSTLPGEQGGGLLRIELNEGLWAEKISHTLLKPARIAWERFQVMDHARLIAVLRAAPLRKRIGVTRQKSCALRGWKETKRREFGR